MVFPHYTELHNSILSTHTVVRIYQILYNLTGGQIGALIGEGVPTCRTSPFSRFRRSPLSSVAIRNIFKCDFSLLNESGGFHLLHLQWICFVLYSTTCTRFWLSRMYQVVAFELNDSFSFSGGVFDSQ